MLNMVEIEPGYLAGHGLGLVEVGPGYGINGADDVQLVGYDDVTLVGSGIGAYDDVQLVGVFGDGETPFYKKPLYIGGAVAGVLALALGGYYLMR
jgi:hypothetical protein